MPYVLAEPRWGKVRNPEVLSEMAGEVPSGAGDMPQIGVSFQRAVRQILAFRDIPGNRTPSVSALQRSSGDSAPTCRSLISARASRMARSRSGCPRVRRDSPEPGSHTEIWSTPPGTRSYTRTRAPRWVPNVLDQQLGSAMGGLLCLGLRGGWRVRVHPHPNEAAGRACAEDQPAES